VTAELFTLAPSVANSLQNFSASPEEKFGRCFCLCQWKNFNISCTSLELERISEIIFKMFGPFPAIFVQNRPKFHRRFIRPPHFLFGFTYAAQQSASWQQWSGAGR
jgi:hypothetical protein